MVDLSWWRRGELDGGWGRHGHNNGGSSFSGFLHALNLRSRIRGERGSPSN